jgi:hypothetical protein
MCVFCAAIPVAASAGVALNNKQVQARKQAEEAAVQQPEGPVPAPQQQPILKVTAGVVFLLVLGSVTYHTLTYLP